MRKEPSGKLHRYQKWSGYHSSSSDNSVVILSEKTVPEYTGTSFAESNTTLRPAFTASETIPFENKWQTHVEKLQRIRDSKRAYKQRIREEARQALAHERRASESWRPERAIDMKPVEGLEMEARWKCERYCRAHTAFLAIQKGVKIHQTAETVSLSCREHHCKAKMRILRNHATGRWRLQEFQDHMSVCLGQEVEFNRNGRRKGHKCTPAYTAKQVARLVLLELKENPSFTTNYCLNCDGKANLYPPARFASLSRSQERIVAYDEIKPPGGDGYNARICNIVTGAWLLRGNVYFFC